MNASEDWFRPALAFARVTTDDSLSFLSSFSLGRESHRLTLDQRLAGKGRLVPARRFQSTTVDQTFVCHPLLIECWAQLPCGTMRSGGVWIVFPMKGKENAPLLHLLLVPLPFVPGPTHTIDDRRGTYRAPSAQPSLRSWHGCGGSSRLSTSV